MLTYWWERVNFVAPWDASTKLRAHGRGRNLAQCNKSSPRPNDIKQTFRSADILRNGRVVFDIGGNKYRLIAAIHYRGQRVYVRFIGTHSEYDKINAETV